MRASTHGLGLGAAKALGALGACLFINGRDPHTVEQVVNTLRDTTKGSYRAASGDVSTIEGREAILAACGNIEVLINNAGGPPAGKFEELAEEDWIAAIEQNMLAPLMLTKRVTPHMRTTGLGTGCQYYQCRG